MVLATPLLLILLLMCFYFEKEINQLEHTFILGPKYTFVPFLLAAIAGYRQENKIPPLCLHEVNRYAGVPHFLKETHHERLFP